MYTSYSYLLYHIHELIPFLLRSLFSPAPDPIKCPHRVRSGTLSRQTQRHTQTCEWRTKLVRNVAEQSLLCFHHRLEPFSHRVEITPQLTNFITSLCEIRPNARGEIAFGELIGCSSKFE